MDSLQRIRTGMFCTMESKVQVKKQDSTKNNMGYTAYNLNVLGYEEFAKRVELLFKDTDAVDDSQYKTMMEAFANHAFLRRIHTVDNAAIPYQLHAEVVNRIIDNQGRFYPWLIDAREHILKVLTSEGMLKSIIGRQFTENSWEAKLFTAAIAAKYPGTVVIPIKAGVIGAVRSRIGIPKSLKANQFYHAHDALLAAEVGRYMELAKPALVHNRVKYEQYMRKIKLIDEENKKAPKSQLDFFAGGFFFDRVDKDTGEVYWNKDEEVERIYRACGWKNLRVTYAAFEDGGAFWKQTIYSPREKSKLIATKSDRPAEIYGGYSSQTFANFFVYEVMKKKVKQLRFGAVPAAIASKSDPDTYNAMLEMYARGLAKTAKEKFVRIVRARVLKNTMIELYGERFRIAGEKQVYPVRQMPLAIDEVYLLKGVETIAAAGNAGASAKIDFEKAAESLVGFWDLLLEKLPVNYPKLTVQLKLGSLKHPKDILAATSESEFPAIVYKIAEAEIQVMEQASGLRNMSDTKILGGNTFGGSLVFTFNKVLNDPKSKACFIDTTPAGLYEVKTKIW